VDPLRLSFLRHSGQEHALIHPLPQDNKLGVMGVPRAQPIYSEIRIKSQSRLYSSSRFRNQSKPHERSRKVKVSHRIILVCLQSSTKPPHSLFVSVQECFGKAHPIHPKVAVGVARRKTQCLLNMSLGFAGTAAS